MFVKLCDNCGKKLGGDESFVQTRGTVSDQYENDVVEFRYLTNGRDETHTFCDDACDHKWREKQRKIKKFSSRL